MSYKLGKLPASHDDRDLKMVKYLSPDLKPAPVHFGHQDLVQNDWGMLGNDEVGDCAEACPAHVTMLWNAAAGKQIKFNTKDVLQAYSDITGYDPNDPNSDQGSDMRDVLKYRKKTGMKDSNGNIHKIGAYVSIDPKNFHQLLVALHLFEAVEMGFDFPDSAMDQFDNGEAWTLVDGAQIEGGHAVPVVGRPNAEGLYVVTWGALQHMGRGFYETYNDEAWVVLSEEMLSGGKSLEGFDLATLQDDLAKL